MLRQRTHVRLARGGAVSRVVREHYLRDDIGCGVRGCGACAGLPGDAPLRPDAQAARHGLAGGRAHVLVPDTNVVLRYAALLDERGAAGPVFPDVVLLQTVLAEVGARSAATGARLRRAAARARAEDGPRLHVYSNEHARPTYEPDRAGVSPNDRNDAAVRRAAAWYASHLAPLGVCVIFVTEDAACRRIAAADGSYVAADMAAYVAGAPGAPATLGDALLSAAGAAVGGRAAHAPHWSAAQCEAAQREGRVHRGVFRVDARDRTRATVSVARGGRTLRVLLRGAAAQNRALDGDSVYVQLLDATSKTGADAVAGQSAASGAAVSSDHRARTDACPSDSHRDGLPTGDPVARTEETPSVVDRTDGAVVDPSDSTDGAVADSSDPANSAVANSSDRTDGIPVDSNTALDDDEEGTGDAAAAVDVPDEPDVVDDGVPGRVVGVAQRSGRPVVAAVDGRTAAGGAGTVTVVPLDRRLPRVRVRTRHAAHIAGQRVVVVVDGWGDDCALPHGRVVRVLGRAGDCATETEALLLAHDVSAAPFSRAVLACLPPADYSISDDASNREDMTALPVVSVDPPGCTDIDDALHARVDPDTGLLEVGVHIADVSHYVRADTALDAEAAARATTVYLVDRRVDMLPARLGSDLCSLRGGVLRLAFSVVWLFDDDAHVRSVRFARTAIRSRAALTYDQAQAILDESPGAGRVLAHLPNAEADAVAAGLRSLHRVAKVLRQRRMDAGALTLSAPEVRFSVARVALEEAAGPAPAGTDCASADAFARAPDDDSPIDVKLKAACAATSLVEEFMLLANCAAAARVHAFAPEAAVLRRHPPPPAESFAGLNRALAARGLPALDVSSSLALARSLDAVGRASSATGDAYVDTLVRVMATRCMFQAQYFVAGGAEPGAFAHYGLAAPIYTHFTSPIRRYADILVHRQLAAAIASDGPADPALAGDRARLDDACANINYRHRNAQAAQRASTELYTTLYFRARPPVVQDAYVVRVAAGLLGVLLPNFGVEGAVRWSPAARVSFDEAALAVRAEDDPALAVTLFQRVSVRLSVREDDATLRHRLVVELVEPPLFGALPDPPAKVPRCSE